MAVNYLSHGDAAEQVKNAILSEGGVAETFRADVADLSQTERMTAEIGRRLGRPSVLVANAGISAFGLAADMGDDEWNRLFAVNVRGVRNAVRCVLPDMIDKKSGKIVTVASVWGEVGASCEAAYSATKAAVIGYTRALAKELAPSGINVNCVSPGVIDTEMNARLTREERRAVMEEIPLGRFGTAEDVARAILFLASSAADYITGEVLGVNGGFGR